MVLRVTSIKKRNGVESEPSFIPMQTVMRKWRNLSEYVCVYKRGKIPVSNNTASFVVPNLHTQSAMFNPQEMDVQSRSPPINAPSGYPKVVTCYFKLTNWFAFF